MTVQHHQAQIESDQGPTSSSKNKLSEESTQKILNQVNSRFGILVTVAYIKISVFGM